MTADVMAKARIELLTGQVGTGKKASAAGAVFLRGFEVEACSGVLARASPPEVCGPAIPVAPARGPMQTFMPREVVMTAAGNYVSRRSGYKGRHAARVADAFDLMTDQAERAHRREVLRAQREKRERPAEFCPPFTNGQVTVARDYAILTERCAASGVKCASLEVLRQSAGGGGDREVAIFRDFQRLRAFHARIGTGLAKEVRRIRPGAAPRSAIRVRVLVDMVCLGGISIQEVLLRHGWATKNDSPRKALMDALRASLDRMQGYDLVKPQNMA